MNSYALSNTHCEIVKKNKTKQIRSDSMDVVELQNETKSLQQLRVR